MTVTIDDHLLAEAKVLAASQRRTLGEIIEDALRVSLQHANGASAADHPADQRRSEGKPLVDILDKEALAEVLGDNEWPRRDDPDG